MSIENKFSGLLARFLDCSLIKKIMWGLVAGITLAWYSPNVAIASGILGTLFVSALKAVAPLLVLLLVSAAIAKHKQGQKTSIRPIVILYLFSTFFAAVVAVILSHLFPQMLVLSATAHVITPPTGIVEILRGLLLSMVANPIEALLHANYIGILVWGMGLGLAFRHSSETSKTLLNDTSEAVTWIVRAVIRCSPVGIFGLIASTLASTGFDVLWKYTHLLILLIGCMLLMALIFHPLLVFLKIRRNPYPLVFTCLRESGVTAFFTRSSAANIPVNMALAKQLKLDKDTYTVSIPLGASISMSGASITITTLTMAAVHTLGINIDIPTAILLSLVASLCACGASGVAGGSLLLIPVACNMFGIPNEVAMQVVAVGFIISILQDSAETALNSSTDILFTAAVCLAKERSVL